MSRRPPDTTRALHRQKTLYETISNDFADSSRPVVTVVAPDNEDEDEEANTITTSSTSHSNTAQSSLTVLAVAFVAALATGGPTYAFGIYSNALKQQLHLTQSALDTIASATFAAGVVSFLPRLLVDHVGIRTAMTVGGIIMSVSFLLYWYVATSLSTQQDLLLLLLLLLSQQHVIVTLLCVLGFSVFVSNSLVIGSLFKGIVVSTAHGSRGSAVGAAKGFVGIGSGVYAILFQSLHTRSDLDFMLLAAVMAIVAIAVPAWYSSPVWYHFLVFDRPDHPSPNDEKYRVYQIRVVTHSKKSTD